MLARVGYIIASKRVTEEGHKVGFLYREPPDNAKDSGWRVFAGDESREYIDDATNFAMYNATTIVDLDPEVAVVLGEDYPVAYERDALTGHFVRTRFPLSADP
jgi:hypothetical protein